MSLIGVYFAELYGRADGHVSRMDGMAGEILCEGPSYASLGKSLRIVVLVVREGPQVTQVCVGGVGVYW